MSVSTDGILCFGIQVGDGDGLPSFMGEADDWGEFVAASMRWWLASMRW